MPSEYMDLASLIAGMQAFAVEWGYLGLFLVNIAGSASIVLPLVPSILAVIALASVLDPWLIGLSSGAGAAIGELTGYALGKGGGSLVKDQKWFTRAQKWQESKGMFPVIILFAATPLPADVVGILAGAVGYDVRKFLLANLIGKVIKFTLVAWAARLGLELVLAVFR